MFKTSLKIVDTYIDKITDGTLRTTQDFCNSDRDRLMYLCTETKTGYLQIRNTDLFTHGIDDFKAIVSNDDQWEPFVHSKLDSYFGEQLDLSPQNSAAGDATPDMTPETLIRLSLGRIETQFPGGLGQDYGDQDVRDLIAAKGLVLYHNYKHLHAARRGHIAKLYRYTAIVAAVAAAWLIATAVWPVALPVPALVVLLPVAVIAFHLMSILTRRRHRVLADQFNAATRQSCAVVSKCAIIRQDNMIFASHAMFEIANSGKEDYWAQGRLKRWTEVNEKWCELIFWLNGRVTANANFAFIRSKLIGMTLEGLQAEAQFESLKLTALWLAALIAAGLVGLGFGLHAPLDTATLVVFTGYMAWQTLRLHNLIKADEVADAVEEVLHSDSLQKMKGHREAKLHEEVARFMKREKLKQLYAERTRLNSGVMNDVVGLV